MSCAMLRLRTSDAQKHAIVALARASEKWTAETCKSYCATHVFVKVSTSEKWYFKKRSGLQWSKAASISQKAAKQGILKCLAFKHPGVKSHHGAEKTMGSCQSSHIPNQSAMPFHCENASILVIGVAILLRICGIRPPRPARLRKLVQHVENSRIGGTLGQEVPILPNTECTSWFPWGWQ